MSEPSTVLHIPAGVGIDQMTSPEHVQPGSANLYAGNVRVTHDKALEKRQGMSRVAAANSSNSISGLKTTAETIHAYKDTIVCTGKDEVGNSVLDQFIDRTAFTPQWITRGMVSECVPSVNDFSAATGISHIDGVYVAATGTYVVAYMQSSTIRDSVSNSTYIHGRLTLCTVDAESGELLFERTFPTLSDPDSGSTSAGSPYFDISGPIKVVAYASRVYVSYVHAQTTGGVIVTDYRCTSFDVSSVSPPVLVNTVVFGTAPSIVFAPLYDNAFDVTVGSTSIVFAWGDSSTLTLKIASYSALTNPISIQGAAFDTTIPYDASRHLSVALSIPSTFNTRMIIVVGGATLSTRVYDVSVPGTFTPSGPLRVIKGQSSRNPSASIKSESATQLVWTVSAGVVGSQFPNTAGGSLSLAVDELTYVFSGSTFNITKFSVDIPGWSPMSRGATVGGRTYMEACSDNSSNAVLVDVSLMASSADTSLRPVAWVAPRLQGFSFDMCRHVIRVGSNYMITLQAVKRTPTAYSLRLCRYDFSSSEKRQAVSYAGKLYLSGGLLSEFDGRQPVETAFVMTPAVYGVLNANVVISGTYNYTAIYEYVDASGNVTVSAPAPIFQVTTVGSQGVTLNVRGCLMTTKGYRDYRGYGPEFRQITIKLYRTQNGGNQYFLLATLIPGSDGMVVGYSDLTTDVQLISGATLYKSPGLVATQKDRDSPAALVMLCECNGVLVGVAEDLRTVRHMSQVVIGESPWHSDVWQLTVPGDGPITGIASLDGSLVIFREKEIFIVSLDPPADNASSGGFGQPRQLAASCGCIDGDSLLVTGAGVFFQSDRGIELLDRNYSINFIGNQVQDFLESNGTVGSAVLDIRNAVVRLDLNFTGLSTSYSSMVFDLTIGQWVSFDTIKRPSADSCYATYRGVQRYVQLSFDGVVMYEDDATCLDDGSFVQSFWVPAYLKSEMQRENQTYQALVFYRAPGRASMNCDIEYDWDRSEESKVWDETTVSTTAIAGSRGIGQLEARVSGRHQAIYLAFSDIAPAVADSGKGVVWLGLSLDLAPHQGATQGTPLLPSTLRR